MPSTVERHCNLTLTRNEWAVLVALLDNVPGDMSRAVRQCIRATLNAQPDLASVSIDRESQKWATVLHAVWPEAMRRKGEYNRLVRTMTPQISAAEFTQLD
jgi:hypothetical protein